MINVSELSVSEVAHLNSIQGITVPASGELNAVQTEKLNEYRTRENASVESLLLVNYGDLSPEQRLKVMSKLALKGSAAKNLAKAKYENYYLRIATISSQPFNRARTADGKRRNDYDVDGGFVKFSDICDNKGTTVPFHEGMVSANGRAFSKAQYPYFSDLNGAEYAQIQINVESRATGVRRFNRMEDLMRSISGNTTLSADLTIQVTELWNANVITVSGLNGNTKMFVAKLPKGSEDYMLTFKPVTALAAKELIRVTSIFKIREENENNELSFRLAKESEKRTGQTKIEMAREKRAAMNAEIRQIMEDFGCDMAAAAAMFAAMK